MNTIFKWIGTLLPLLLLAIHLSGCDTPPWESGLALSLKVQTPQNAATVNTSTVTVSGRVTGTQSANASVTINGTSVPLKDGKFSTDVTLTEGKNVIKVAATGGGASLKEEVTVTYAPTK